LEIQSLPPLGEVKIAPVLAAAVSLPPSAEEATENHRALAAGAGVQLAPASDDKYNAPGLPSRSPKAAATIREPSADPATLIQYCCGSGAADQLWPELVEMKTSPPHPAAASLTPSLEEKTPIQFWSGTLAGLQLAPASAER